MFSQGLLRFVVFMCAFLIASVANAATLFVSPCGSDFWAGVNNICLMPLGPKRTIQAAINQAVNGDTIIVMPGVYIGQIDLDGKAITLQGVGGAGATFIDGNGAGPVVMCNSLEGPGTVIEGFTITGGSSAGDGGGMFIALASPTINNCVFEGNHSSQWGGGLYAIASSSTITDCMFNNNDSALHGGGAYFVNGLPTLNNCTFTGNQTGLWGGGLVFDNNAGASASGCHFNGNNSVLGGGLYAFGGTVTLDDCTFTGNIAAVHGGGLELYDMDSADVSDCTFTSNSLEMGSGMDGGGMRIRACAPNVSNCVFESNSAHFGGGAVSCVDADGTTFAGCVFTTNENTGCCGASAMQVENSDISLFACSFTANVVSQFGGAITANDSALTVTWCGFHDNEALDFVANGAAINFFNSSLQVGQTVFSGNQVGAGGGGAVYGTNSSASFEGSTFANNTVALGGNSGGGAIRLETGSLSLDACTFNTNSGQTGGAAYLLDMTRVDIVDSTFNGNTATDHGGAVYLEGGPITIADSEFNNNIAGNTGGGLFTAGILITPNSQQPLDMRNVQFNGNHATVAGGGLSAGTPTTAVGCGFLNNTSNDGGGAVGVGSFADMKFYSCRFDANQATGAGGALIVGAMTSGSSALLVNSIVSNNTSSFGNGAIYETVLGGHLDIVNSAIVDNTGGGITIDNAATQSVVANTVLWGNTSGSDLDGLMPEVMFCDIQDGGMGVVPMSVDPGFVNAATGNYHLAAGSPCIDAGLNWALPQDATDLDNDGNTIELIPLDFDGLARFANDGAAADTGCGGLTPVDIGPYESAGVAVDDITPGDVNGDGQVGILDFLELLATWGVCPGACCPADFDLNGFVGIEDFLTVLANWS